jgi:putative transposase
VARAPRIQRAGAYYHVIARGVAGAPIVGDDIDRRTLVALIERVARRKSWRVHAYCVMTTHLHLVVETDQPNISGGMQNLLGAYAQRFNTRWGRFGHLFAERFSSRLIEDEEYFWEACHYVLHNPVRAGVVRAAELWPWSGGLAASDMAEGLTRSSELARGWSAAS